MGIVIHSARLVADGRTVGDGWLRIGEGRVTGRGDGEGWRAATRTGDEVVDASATAGDGAFVTPGLIDLHGHGGGGSAAEEGAGAVRSLRAFHRAHGTTRAVVSLVTAPLDTLAARAAEVGRLSAQQPDILGSHLEGPFLAEGHHGAHDPALLVPPTAEAVGLLLDAGLVEGRQTIRQVTIAPELPGGIEAVERFVAAGVVVAVGHTGADAATARRAFDAGATLLTHAFNAMPGIHHRAPGPVPVAAEDERVVLELIADGVHVVDDVMRMLLRAAPGRVALVTDAMAAAGMPDGDFRLGGLDVEVRDGVARVRGGGSIAGSTLTQDAALRRLTRMGVPLPEVVEALTAVPARALGLADGLGTLDVGATADLVLWTADGAVSEVWTAGTPSSGE